MSYAQLNRFLPLVRPMKSRKDTKTVWFADTDTVSKLRSGGVVTT